LDRIRAKGVALKASGMGDSVSTGDLTPLDGSLEMPAVHVTDDAGGAVEGDSTRFYEAVERSQTDSGCSISSGAGLERQPSQDPEDIAEVHDAAEHSENADAPHPAEPISLELSPITFVSSQIPTLPQQQRISFSTWTIIIDQESQTPQHNLTLSPVTPTFVQEPIPARASKGLYFVAAHAIVYGFTTFVVILFIIRNIDEDIQCGLLASDMGYGFLAALVLCVALHMDLVGKILAYVEGLLAMLAPKREPKRFLSGGGHGECASVRGQGVGR
jgi:hypothetical protein